MDTEMLNDCWTMFQREHNDISVDRVLCNPGLRSEFLVPVSNVDSEAREADILWKLMGLRKSKRLPKKSPNSIQP